MVRYITQGAEVDIFYIAHKHTSGLTDTTVTITDLSDDSSELAATTLSEVGTKGIYKIAHTFTGTGNYLVQCNSASLPRLDEEIYEVISLYVAPTPPYPPVLESADIYSVERTINAGQAVIFPNTPDLTGRIHTLEITSDEDCQVEIQNSTDEGISWDDVIADYQVDGIRDKRSIFCDGLIRVTCTSNEATESQTVTLRIETTPISTLWITPEDVWRTAGLTAGVLARGDLAWFIKRAVGRIRFMTGREYEATQVTETYAGDGSNILILDHYPIITLDTLTIDGTSVTPANVDVWLETGKLILTDDAEETKFRTEGDGSRTTSVTYTHGTSEVPEHIKRLTECIAAMMMLIHQTGGTYDDITSYTIGGVTASVGEPYMNIKATLEYLQREVTELMKYVRKQPFMA